MIVIGKKVKQGDIQYLVIGKEYNVSNHDAKHLMSTGQVEEKGAAKPAQKTTRKKSK
tara:strand:- start:889 stop:1059 length:171 start_codon:yes stop_codon:yes gene_type:complete